MAFWGSTCLIDHYSARRFPAGLPAPVLHAAAVKGCARRTRRARGRWGWGRGGSGVAGHARLSARLLEHGGGGVKTVAGSRDRVTSVTEISPTSPEVSGDSGPREDQRGRAVRALAVVRGRAGGRVAGSPPRRVPRGERPLTVPRCPVLVRRCTPAAHLQRLHPRRPELPSPT